MDLSASRPGNNLLFKLLSCVFTIQLFTQISSYELATFHPRLRLQVETFVLLHLVNHANHTSHRNQIRTDMHIVL